MQQLLEGILWNGMEQEGCAWRCLISRERLGETLNIPLDLAWRRLMGVGHDVIKEDHKDRTESVKDE